MTKTSWSELGGLLLRSAACAVVVLWFAAVGAVAPAAHADDDYVRQANAVFELSDANGTPPSVQCVGHAFVGQTPANSIEASTTITCRPGPLDGPAGVPAGERRLHPRRLGYTELP
jgi:hypothetical protein